MAYLLLIIGLLCIVLGLTGCSFFVIKRAISRSNLSLTFTSISHHLDQKDSINSVVSSCSKDRTNELRELELRMLDRLRRIEKKIDLLIESTKGS